MADPKKGAARAPRKTLVIPSLRGGGAERAMVVVAGYWAARGDDVTLVTIEPTSADFYPLDPRVKRVALGHDLPSFSASKAELLRYAARVVWGLRRQFARTRPDVVVSFMEITNILTLLGALGTRRRVVVMEQTDPRRHKVSAIWRALRLKLYPRADAVVVQTQSVREWAAEFVPAAKLHVVPNPVLVEAPAAQPPEHDAILPEGPVVMAMGRLEPVKGFDLLFRAFARVRERHPEWSLVILGEGSIRGELEALAAELGITGRLRLPGAVKDPASLLRRAGVFVLSSRYEGLPYALMEAMACGLPVISTDCPSGPGEIIRDGVDGVLVPTEDVDALAAALDRLMGDGGTRERLAGRAPEVLDRFGMEPVMAEWDAVLNGVSPPRM